MELFAKKSRFKEIKEQINKSSNTIQENKKALNIIKKENRINEKKSPISFFSKQLEKQNLVNILNINENIKVNLLYATKNNFIKKKLYSNSICFLRIEVAKVLSSLQNELEKEGLGLLIWDAYRPHSVQKILRSFFPDNNFIAKISNHNKGIAVDLTICDNNGKSIPMPTDFDDFSEKAHHNYNNLSKKILLNRKKLRELMIKYGFTPFEGEWWHYDFLKIKDPKILNIPI